MLIPGHRSGQLTIYIILSILVVSIVAIAYLRPHRRMESGQPPEAQEVVNRIISQCLERGLEESLITLGKTGDLDASAHVHFENQSIAVVYDGQTITLPSLRAYARPIAEASQPPFLECLDDTPHPFAFTIDEEGMDLTVRFDDSTTTLQGTIPVTIPFPYGESIIQRFSAQSPISFTKIHAIMTDFLEQAANDAYLLPLSPLSTADATVTLYPVSDSTLLIHIVDKDSIIDGKPWSITIAAEYPASDLHSE